MKRFSTSGLIPTEAKWFPFINTFSVKNINTFWSKSKINAKIIIVQWFLSTQHPSSYEMVKPSPPSGKQLLIRECCARRAYRVMWHNCFSRCSRPIGMKKLSYKHRCKLACHAHVSTLFTGHKQRFFIQLVSDSHSQPHVCKQTVSKLLQVWYVQRLGHIKWGYKSHTINQSWPQYLKQAVSSSSSLHASLS